MEGGEHSSPGPRDFRRDSAKSDKDNALVRGRAETEKSKNREKKIKKSTEHTETVLRASAGAEGLELGRIGKMEVTEQII